MRVLVTAVKWKQVIKEMLMREFMVFDKEADGSISLWDLNSMTSLLGSIELTKEWEDLIKR